MAERQRSNSSSRDERSRKDPPTEEPRRGPSPYRKDAYDRIAELEKVAGVDKHALDDNLEEQPDLFYRVSKACAIANSQADIAKMNIDELTARLDGTYREDFAKAGEKVTDTAVKQAIANDPEIRQATTDWLEKREIAARWMALKDTYVQRSYVMKELVTLYTVGYFSDAVGGKARNQQSDARETQARSARTQALEERNRDRAEAGEDNDRRRNRSSRDY